METKKKYQKKVRLQEQIKYASLRVREANRTVVKAFDVTIVDGLDGVCSMSKYHK